MKEKHYAFLDLEILFNDILGKTVKTHEELKYCVETLGQDTHDWFEDEKIEE